MNISAVIITKNEERHIADCIASLSFVKEVIVVDSESNDRTQEIAASAGAHVIVHPWKGYGEQKNLGAAAAQYPWILFIDADERVSPELMNVLLAMPEDSPHSVYWITIEDIFLGRRMRQLAGHNPRLIKKGGAKWSSKNVHEQMIYADTHAPALYKDGISGEITAPIIHLSYTRIADYLAKMHKYTTLDATDMKIRGVHRSGRAISSTWTLPYRLAIRQILKMILYKKGFRDGWQGIVWALLSGYYEFEMGKKYLRFPSLHKI